MRLPSGTVDQYVYFYAVDSTDFTTPETGLTGFTVYRSRDGGAPAAYTTPTVNETDATNMAGVYELLVDEDTTLAAGNDSEEMVLHISKTGMAPVVLTIEIYRPKITLGETLSAASGAVTLPTIPADWITASGIAADAIGSSELAASAVTEIQAGLATDALLTTVAGYLDTEIAAIKAKTDNLPAAPAAVGDIPTALQNADALLNRDMSAVSDTNARSPLNALRLLRNKYSIAAGTMTVTKENDITQAWTAVVTTDAAADPIIASDPA